MGPTDQPAAERTVPFSEEALARFRNIVIITLTNSAATGWRSLLEFEESPGLKPGDTVIWAGGLSGEIPGVIMSQGRLSAASMM